MTGASPLTPRSQIQQGGLSSIAPPMQDDAVDILINNSNEANANSLLKGIVHQRSQSLSGVPPGSQNTTDSPKHGVGKADKVGQSPETQLKYENERLRLALAQRYVL